MNGWSKIHYNFYISKCFIKKFTIIWSSRKIRI